MALTYDTMLAEVARLAKMNSLYVSENISVIEDSIIRAQFDLSREHPERFASAKVANVAISLAAGFTTNNYPLPTDFIRIDQLNFLSSSFRWQLTQRDLRIPPAKIFGKPRAYVITQGSNPAAISYGISLDPNTGIDTVNDKLVLDYYQSPVAPTFGIGQLVLDTINYAEITRRATMYVFIYANKVPEAQFLQQLQMVDAPTNTEDTTGTPQTH